MFNQYGENLLENGALSTSVPSNGTGGGWTSANIDSVGGWQSGGYFILNSNGQPPHPTISQTLTDLLPGVTYQVTGQFINVYGQYGGDAAGSFQALITAPFGGGTEQLGSFTAHKSSAPGWTAFSFTFTADGTTATLSLSAELTTDASFAIDNLVLRAINVQSYATDFGPGSVDLYVDKAGREHSREHRQAVALPGVRHAARAVRPHRRHRADRPRSRDGHADDR